MPNPLRHPIFAVRTPADTPTIVPSIRGFIRQLDPQVAIDRTTTLDERVWSFAGGHRQNATRVGLFAVPAAVLAAVSVFGLVAYSAAERTYEIGVRLALGATRSNILGLLLRQTLAWSVAGVTVGLAAAGGLSRYLESTLFGIAPLDASTFAAVGAALLMMTALAASLPARRATHVNPVGALRSE
jgi:putative ABC transport system permease protein